MLPLRQRPAFVAELLAGAGNTVPANLFEAFIARALHELRGGLS
jgi:hypothetical protein